MILVPLAIETMQTFENRMDKRFAPGGSPLALRHAGDQDEAVLYEIYASTRTEEMARVQWNAAEQESFLRMQFTAQTNYYREVYPDMRSWIILWEGRPAGRILVTLLHDEFRLVDLAVLPLHRGLGIGTQLLRAVMDEAQRLEKCVRLHVERFNRARSLYDRLGFVSVRETDVYIMMEWQFVRPQANRVDVQQSPKKEHQQLSHDDV